MLVSVNNKLLYEPILHCSCFFIAFRLCFFDGCRFFAMFKYSFIANVATCFQINVGLSNAKPNLHLHLHLMYYFSLATPLPIGTPTRQFDQRGGYSKCRSFS